MKAVNQSIGNYTIFITTDNYCNNYLFHRWHESKISIHMYLTSSAQRKSYPSPWRLFVRGAVWQALLSTCYALQASHMDQRPHQHIHGFRPCFRCFTEGENQGHLCSHSQTAVSWLIRINMLSLYSSFLVLPGEEAEADVALGKPSATAPTAILATQEIECVLVSKIIILKDKIKDKKRGLL